MEESSGLRGGFSNNVPLPSWEPERRWSLSDSLSPVLGERADGPHWNGICGRSPAVPEQERGERRGCRYDDILNIRAWRYPGSGDDGHCRTQLPLTLSLTLRLEWSRRVYSGCTTACVSHDKPNAYLKRRTARLLLKHLQLPLFGSRRSIHLSLLKRPQNQETSFIKWEMLQIMKRISVLISFILQESAVAWSQCYICHIYNFSNSVGRNGVDREMRVWGGVFSWLCLT